MAEKNDSLWKLLVDGIWNDNPLFRLGLGIFPALAVTVKAENGLVLGIATACVLVLTSLLMGLVGGLITEKGRIPVTLAASAVFATIVQLILGGWFPEYAAGLGLFGPLIAVNSLILYRAGFFASSYVAIAGLADGIGMGIGYTFALTLVGAIRELIGYGSVFGKALLPAAYKPMLMAAMPAGGLLVVGLCMGIANAFLPGRKEEKEGSEE